MYLLMGQPLLALLGLVGLKISLGRSIALELLVFSSSMLSTASWSKLYLGLSDLTRLMDMTMMQMQASVKQRPNKSLQTSHSNPSGRTTIDLKPVRADFKANQRISQRK